VLTPRNNILASRNSSVLLGKNGKSCYTIKADRSARGSGRLNDERRPHALEMGSDHNLKARVLDGGDFLI
jgi:hypothetical protein